MRERVKEAIEGILVMLGVLVAIFAVAFLMTWGWWETPNPGITVGGHIKVLGHPPNNRYDFYAVTDYRTVTQAVKLCAGKQVNATVRIESIDGKYLTTCAED